MNLIHVSKFENIKSIIEDGLKFSISKEDFIHVNSNENIQWERTFYIPMISFFGMPISDHLNLNQTYGDLGVILKDDMKLKEEFNPVRYYNIFSSSIKTHVEIPNQTIPAFHSTLKGASTIGYNANVANMWRSNLIFSKPFTAHLFRRCKKCSSYYINKNMYDFGLEREWRIIPSDFNTIDFNKTNNLSEISAQYADDLFLPIKKDIQGFIVENKSKKKKLKDFLKPYNIAHLKIYVRKNYGWGPKSNLKCDCKK